MLLFCAKAIMKESHNFEQAHLKKTKKKKKEKHLLSGNFLVWYFRDAFCTTGCVFAMKTLEDEWYVVIKAYKFTVFDRLFFV